MTSERVLIGLSGGVDSAVAAHVLIEQGYRVEALFMKNWEEDDAPGYCAAAEDLADAQAVAERLGIPLRTVNFATEYWDRVFAHFLAEYRALRTPNPDILCNSEIKFRAFLDFALTLGADWIATGHYAQIIHASNRSTLHLAKDTNKDQTYFLHRLDQQQLARALFPLSDLSKPEVRALAQDLGLANAQKKDSTGICFIGERRFADFLARYLPREPGPIETPEGQVLGEHQGLAYYTIGQRQGLGIGGQRDAGEAPWFVAAKAPDRNALIVVQGGDHPLLFAQSLSGEQLHWIAGTAPAPPPFDCLCRLRHRQPLQACTLVEYDSDSDRNQCHVRFAIPQRAITPGQSAVFYHGDQCLGGCVIAAATD
ncbi:MULTISPECIES: tRNA 2-thiouridine(34) synthase MnmA [Thiorhodovibrio]|uniref:tRNA 2-thiouridine(34) synthase MnmA n=1 Tax=Thiorhodovibrio TaxID=61593 RepID=UPI001911CAE8|nr:MULTISPECIES: tRNA 2-thiouridine(34) synthase MnmA [Thiorhodovibrio]MBK5967711.1 tRNA 2-thiouridine(34) synthase MnmA [Thiorhodovibrio winogradskyi]WPL11659.1 tRNA-specific 2-thiouridylase MnmA [Thiorhodovibrio litoralis]